MWENTHTISPPAVVLSWVALPEDQYALPLTHQAAHTQPFAGCTQSLPRDFNTMEATIQLTMRQPGLRYIAVAGVLQKMIEDGRYKAGDRLSGQHELARQFGVSLTTMRAAIGILEREGFLRSEHGLGTFVMGADRRSVRSLVVDDDPASVALLTEVLRGQGAQVASANSKAQAMEKVTSQEFDIIFLDIIMPGGSGIETIAEFKRMDLAAAVVIVTGIHDTNMIQEAMDYGPLTLIRKPVQISQVRDVLRAMRPVRGREGR